ncbi:MAG TPA: IS481 family transposase [Steroidobacteraceae bacterium]|nr:IS481 family transposase [Steroidobacteraceae bacterium]
MHKNARLTPKGRALVLARLEAGQHQVDVAQAMGVSLTTVKKWLRRHRQEGPEGLEDRSSRPRCSPRALLPGTRQAVIALRRQRRTGCYIARRLGLSAASVSRILRTAHLSRWRELEPTPPVVRYERAEPGELIHLDIKKLGRIKGLGHRIHGDRRSALRNRGIGWDYVHVAIDDASRIALAEVAADERGDTATALLMRTVERYRAQGVGVQRVMTDNGSPYLSKAFAAACRQLGIRHLRTKPYTPRTNGKAERFIQTALREWAYASPYLSSEQRTQALKTWLHHYNWHRPHSALQSKPPISKLNLGGNNLLRLHS